MVTSAALQPDGPNEDLPTDPSSVVRPPESHALAPELAFERAPEIPRKFFFDPVEFKEHILEVVLVSDKIKQSAMIDGYLNGKPFQEVFQFLQEATSQFTLDMAFFEGEQSLEHRHEFYEELWEFMRNVDSDYISHHNRMITDYAVPDGFFPEGSLEKKDGWQNKLRTSYYLAFFVHYGQKRKAKKKENQRGSRGDRALTEEDLAKQRLRAEKKAVVGGVPEEVPREAYIMHPVAVSTQESAKVGAMDIHTSCAEVLHDTLEDFMKAMFGTVKDVKPGEFSGLHLPKDQAGAFEAKLKGFIATKISPDTLDLVEAASKKRVPGREMSRPENILIFLQGLCEAIKAGNIKAIRRFIVKLADRLHNTATIEEHEDKDKMEEIWAETARIFLPLAQALQMDNAAEWLRDFLCAMDQGVREKYLSRLDVARSHVEKKKDFRNDFHRLLQEEFGGMDLKKGKDYVLNSRTRGVRFMVEELKAEDNDPSLAASRIITGKRGAHSFQKEFNHYWIFVVKNESHAAEIHAAAERVFQKMFPYSLSELPPEATLSSFGQRCLYRTDKSPSGRPAGRYGTIAYQSYKSPKEARKGTFGAPFQAIHDGDHSAVGRVQKIFGLLQPKVERFQTELHEIQSLQGIAPLSSPAEGVGAVASGIRDTLTRGVNRDVLTKLTGAQKKRLLALAELKVSFLFISSHTDVWFSLELNPYTMLWLADPVLLFASYPLEDPDTLMERVERNLKEQVFPNFENTFLRLNRS